MDVSSGAAGSSSDSAGAGAGAAEAGGVASTATDGSGDGVSTGADGVSTRATDAGAATAGCEAGSDEGAGSMKLSSSGVHRVPARTSSGGTVPASPNASTRSTVVPATGMPRRRASVTTGPLGKRGHASGALVRVLSERSTSGHLVDPKVRTGDERTVELAAGVRRVEERAESGAPAAGEGDHMVVEVRGGAPDPLHGPRAGEDRGDVVGGAKVAVGDDRGGPGSQKPGREIVDPLLGDVDGPLRQPGLGVAGGIAEVAEDDDRVRREPDGTRDLRLAEVLMGHVVGARDRVEAEAVLRPRVEGVSVGLGKPFPCPM